MKQALDGRAHIRELVVARKLLLNPLGQKMARRLKQKGVPCRSVPGDSFLEISYAPEPQGIGAIVRQRWIPLSEARPRDGLCWVALHEVRSPGNLGTILRTCDAVGAAGLILVGDRPDPYHPATVRASMGAIFHQRLVRTNHDGLGRWVARHGCTVVGTSPRADIRFDELGYSGPTVLFVGAERGGLSRREEELCDVIVRIPMVGHSDSLNLGVAASLMLYEVFRGRARRA